MITEQQTPAQRKERIQLEKKLYDTILTIEGQPLNLQAYQDKTTLIVQFTIKLIPLMLVVFDELTTQFFDQQYSAQLIVVFIAIEFWLTKNYVGKRMLGVKWFFGQDMYGNQRLMYECRANFQLVDPTQPRLFWIVQFIYLIIGGLLFAEDILIIPNNVGIETRQVALNFMIVSSGMTNAFFFYMASSSAQQRQQSLRRQIGLDYVKKLQLGSIVSFY